LLPSIASLKPHTLIYQGRIALAGGKAAEANVVPGLTEAGGRVVVTRNQITTLAGERAISRPRSLSEARLSDAAKDGGLSG
jgi:hypothetical protein